MSDTFDGVVVEYFNLDAEIAKQKQEEIEDKDIDYQMDDSSSEDDRDQNDYLESQEDSYANYMAGE